MQKEVHKLAALSRLAISPDEMDSLAFDIEAVFGYVGEIQRVSVLKDSVPPERRNIMREDSTPHESGAFSERLVAAAAQTEDGFVKVKKVL